MESIFDKDKDFQRIVDLPVDEQVEKLLEKFIKPSESELFSQQKLEEFIKRYHPKKQCDGKNFSVVSDKLFEYDS
jgi:hypothetical protein